MQSYHNSFNSSKSIYAKNANVYLALSAINEYILNKFT